MHIKSYLFALRIVRMVQYLRNEKQEFILNKQVLRSGTAIGALVVNQNSPKVQLTLLIN